MIVRAELTRSMPSSSSQNCQARRQRMSAAEREQEFLATLGKQDEESNRVTIESHSETIGERVQRDLAAMRPLPAAPFDACDQETGRVSSQSRAIRRTSQVYPGLYPQRRE
ncbi:hypothetical protein DPM13_16270 [Paracoccus mutanolyticus]|uniref:Uncharacterized protein n=1 Tax=Paracoccus mutanolyticus TaxID=1499308 RepID=A0ABM6WTS3_9RHOB|nr:hypothetical protein DPM13_16270 [Paracoccus mutanolyticus]